MAFSLIIATYNRPSQVVRLVKEVLLCVDRPSQIIVVDSSNEINGELLNAEVTYIKSSHKNQPYQRYLGYLVANQDWVIFLDDDLEFLKYSFFTDILIKINNSDISGISVGIDYQNVISKLIKTDVESSSGIFKIINFLTGVPLRKSGKIYLAGLVGSHPQTEGQVEYFSGPVMAFRKELMIHSFDFVLFSLFEKHLAMGEDKAISMNVGLKNKMWYLPENYFKHPPLSSHYFTDVVSFQKKIAYSRLYLSLIYVKVAGRNLIKAYFHYYYFISCRILISVVRLMLKPTKQNLNLLNGNIKGLILTFTHPFKVEKLTPTINWQTDAQQDVAACS